MVNAITNSTNCGSVRRQTKPVHHPASFTTEYFLSNADYNKGLSHTFEKQAVIGSQIVRDNIHIIIRM